MDKQDHIAISTRRKSSKSIPAFGGVWGVRSKNGMLVDKLPESVAWEFFLTKAVGDAIELLKGDAVVARFHPQTGAIVL